MTGEPILIVEDETFLAMDIEHILLSGGYAVAGIAADRNEALRAAKSARIAFVDLNLRDGPTGPAVACELAEHHGITVVYVTANPSQIVPKAKGAIGVVTKPFRESAILKAAAFATRGIEIAQIEEPDIVLF